MISVYFCLSEQGPIRGGKSLSNILDRVAVKWKWGNIKYMIFLREKKS
jgi:hypothetical protein